MMESLAEIWDMILINPLNQHFAGGLTKAWPLKSFSMKHLSGYNNILKLKHDSFGMI